MTRTVKHDSLLITIESITHSMLRQDLNKKSKARVKIDGFLYPNIFLINNQHSLKSYKLGNIEKFSKEDLNSGLLTFI